MNHDVAHCADYDPQKCPKNCYRAQVTADLGNRPDLVGVPYWGFCSEAKSPPSFQRKEAARMDDYISRQAAINIVCDDECEDCPDGGWRYVPQTETAPSR